MKILEVILAVIGLISFLLTSRKESDAAAKKEQEALRNEVKEALASRDASRINAVLGRLRRK